MGIKHMNRIDEELRRRPPRGPELDAYMDQRASTSNEKFFVKNLERVQGDERDAILITIGYGKNPEGRMLYRFGPLNQKGGERRLNVAVTRARSRIGVISSFSSADMDPARLKRRRAPRCCATTCSTPSPAAPTSATRARPSPTSTRSRATS